MMKQTNSRLLQSHRGVAGLQTQAFELSIDALHARLFRTTGTEC
jgi:hypothetical protein